MRYERVLALTALAAALACRDTGEPTQPELQTPPGPEFAGGVAGAAYTTTNPTVDGAGHCLNGPGLVNCNIYDGKQYVWINGGPTNGNSALSDGDYFFVVLVPGGQNPATNDGLVDNLSDGLNGDYTTRMFRVVTNQINSFLGSGHDTYSDPIQGLQIRLIPYDNTTNPGGVYILAVCRLGDAGGPYTYPVDPSVCKYDAFKIREGDGGTNEEGDPELSGLKYYDANGNGQFDAGETGISGWQINYEGGPVLTGAGGTFDVTVIPGTYHFAEQLAGNGWIQTGNTVDQTFSSGNTASLLNKIYTVIAVGDGFTTGLNFGNLCRVTPGGHTLGFWSNKNGQALITQTDINALNAFWLAKYTGNQGDFTGSLSAQKTAYKNWLLSANASNMAYMLSAQMSATYLSMIHGFSNGGVIVDLSPALFGLGPAAPRTVAQEITYANALLQFDQTTIVSDATRAEQERVKNILDQINNGLSFTSTTLADALVVCGTPTFAQ